MTIAVKIIEDTVSQHDCRLTTFLLVYPRIIHAEFLRHRVFSHSVASSRAIPVARMLATIAADPVTPVKWGSNQPGMQAGDEMSGWRLWLVKQLWRSAGHTAANAARVMSALGAHKEIANRVVEPWSHITQIVSATEYDNFFALRCHAHADPTMRELAELMRDALQANVPNVAPLDVQCHLPFVSDADRQRFQLHVLKRISAARCARTSYLNHDSTRPTVADDLVLADRLQAAGHWSPFEHQAVADTRQYPSGTWSHPELHGNFVGWQQLRKAVEK